MALERAVEILKYADQQKKCVIGFDAFNLESINGRDAPSYVTSSEPLRQKGTSSSRLRLS